MLSILAQKLTSNTKAVKIVSVAVFAVLLIAYFFVFKSFGITSYRNTSIILFSSITAFLIIWSLILYSKSQTYEKTITTQKSEIQKEVERRENAIQELQITLQQLSNTSGYLQRIIQESTDLITAVDHEHRYISFNNSFMESMKGYFGVDVSVGVKLDEILADYPKKLTEAKKLWDRSLAGETFTDEQIFTSASGKVDIYELSYSPIKNKNDEIIGASQIARNVTEKNLAAELIKGERDFASAIFDVNKSLIIVLDRDGRIVRFNKACEELSGYKEKEVKGRLIWNILIPAENISRTKQKYKEIDYEDLSKESVYQWITKDEVVKTISWQISSIKDENYLSKYVVATGIDITEKRESEIAQQRMLEILENSTDFISISDPHGKLIYLNSAGRKMLDLAEDTNLNKLRISNFYPEWVNELLKNKAIPHANKNGTWVGETSIKTSDDTEISISQLIMVHRNDHKDIDYYSTVIRDNSYRNKITEELAQAKEETIEKAKMSSEVLANMSHEIRTPMNGIVGLAELLLTSTDLSLEQQDYVDSIQKSSDALLNIINDILDFSKLESGKLAFENLDFDLYKTVESTFELFASTVVKKNLELCLQIDNDVPSGLRGDPGRLRQVLVNFISNAVKFTDKGEIIIKVSVQEDGTSPILHFSVEDTGIGVSANALRSLFKPYTQADTSITRRFGGTGLGLAISKQLITKMNGELGASSEEGVGSTFWFTATFESLKDSSYKPIYDHQYLKNVRTLIVDDNHTQRNVLLSLTKSWGMLSDETNSGENALKVLRAAAKNGEAFEVVLIDLDMPIMDGWALVDKIKADPKLRNTKFVLLPSKNRLEDIEKADLLNIEHIATKPIQQTKLLSTLTHILTDKIEQTNENFETNSINPFIKLENISEDKGTSTMNFQINRNIRILIAEDNLVNQKVILTQVSRLGYQVDLVENGKEVIDALKLKDYSLILMDCQMPVMDGFTATKQIRESEKTRSKHIPIIAVTAHAIEGDRERCLEVGMDDYISKPTKQPILAKAISFWLHQSTQKIISKQKPYAPVLPPVVNQTYSETENISQRLLELEETCGAETVLECIDLFLVDTCNLLKQLKLSIENDDFEQIAIDAHKLKGSAGNMGAVRLPSFSEKLILLAKNERTSSSRLMVKQIVDEFDYIQSVYLEKKEKYEESLQKSKTLA